MRILDRYVVRNFLFSALLCLVVLMSLRIVADLFFNLDEFTEERSDAAARTVSVIAADVGKYYAAQSTLYFRELGGLAIVLAASFMLAWMNHTNELTAILASGVSLRRVLLPIIACVIVLNVLVILDSEFLVPRYRDRAIRGRDNVQGSDRFEVRAVADAKRSCLYSPSVNPPRKAGGKTTMSSPVLVLRDERRAALGLVTAPHAAYDTKAGAWVFTGGGNEQRPDGPDRLPRVQMQGCKQAATTRFVPTGLGPAEMLAAAKADPALAGVDLRSAKALTDITGLDAASRMVIRARRAVIEHGAPEPTLSRLEKVSFGFGPDPQHPLVEIRAERAVYLEPDRDDPRRFGWILEGGRLVYATELSPDNLTLRQSSSWMQLMSTREISELRRLRDVPDERRAVLLGESRRADFFNNILLLLLVTPFVLSRERNIKSSFLLAMIVGVGFFVFIFLTRNIGELHPIVAAWLPVLVFGPVGAVMVGAIKT